MRAPVRTTRSLVRMLMALINLFSLRFSTRVLLPCYTPATRRSSNFSLITNSADGSGRVMTKDRQDVAAVTIANAEPIDNHVQFNNHWNYYNINVLHLDGVRNIQKFALIEQSDMAQTEYRSTEEMK